MCFVSNSSDTVFLAFEAAVTNTMSMALKLLHVTGHDYFVNMNRVFALGQIV